MSQHYNRRNLIALTLGAAASGCVTTDQQQDILGVVLGQTGSAGAGITEAEAAQGIRAALNNGVGSAISTVSKRNGFFSDPQIRIPLPGFLGRAQSTLSKIGMSGALDNLETQLNRGAEAAAPVARDIFMSAIRSLTIRDAIGIVRGPKDAATQYLRRTTRPAPQHIVPADYGQCVAESRRHTHL